MNKCEICNEFKETEEVKIDEIPYDCCQDCLESLEHIRICHSD